MTTTFSELAAMIDQWALGADTLIEVVLPRYAAAFEGDDLRRFVLEIRSETGMGSEHSVLRLYPQAPGGPCMDVVDVGGLLNHGTRGRLPGDARVTVVVEDEPDDRVHGEHDVVDVGAIRPTNPAELPTLVLRLAGAL